MNHDLSLSAISVLFARPDDVWLENVKSLEVLAAAGDKRVASSIGKFSEAVHGLSLEKLEEIHVRTFELLPSCPLEVGIHLFGEDGFKRGAFMARVREELDAYGIDSTRELPDHLTTMLTLCDALPQDERRELLAYAICGPVREMHTRLEEEGNPWRHAMEALAMMVGDPIAQPRPAFVGVDFIHGCTGCLATSGETFSPKNIASQISGLE